MDANGATKLARSSATGRLSDCRLLRLSCHTHDSLLPTVGGNLLRRMLVHVGMLHRYSRARCVSMPARRAQKPEATTATARMAARQATRNAENRPSPSPCLRPRSPSRPPPAAAHGRAARLCRSRRPPLPSVGRLRLSPRPRPRAPPRPPASPARRPPAPQPPARRSSAARAQPLSCPGRGARAALAAARAARRTPCAPARASAPAPASAAAAAAAHWQRLRAERPSPPAAPRCA